jgi:peroxiredoxin
MLADGSAVFAQAIGAELDLTDKGLGVRSRRWASCRVEDAVGARWVVLGVLRSLVP